MSDDPMLLDMVDYGRWILPDEQHDQFLAWVDSHGVYHGDCTAVRLGEGVAEFELYELNGEGKRYFDEARQIVPRYWKQCVSRRPPPIWKPAS